MPDEFQAVPADQWQRLRDHIGSLRFLALAALILVVLLVKTLIEKGVLSGWGDLARDVTTDSGV